ncbi:MAG TPA: DUF4398 domain-containing protein [Alphaproteobacteria bacterium]
MLLLAGCASGEPPTAQLSTARAAIEDAERNDAAQRAPVELNGAREKLSRAEAATRQEEYEQAARLAREAEVDAQLASSKSNSAAAKAALQQVREGIGTLQQEMQRQSR